MFVVVAVEAQEFPIAAIRRIVVVVVVAVMNCKFTKVLMGKLSRAAPADPRVNLEGLRAVSTLTFICRPPGIRNEFVETTFIACHDSNPNGVIIDSACDA